MLATADESLERLGRLVDNLLDMSRLQAGALAMSPQLLSLAEAIPRAVDDLGEAGRYVEILVADDLPEVYADPALLERALVNLLTNAVRYSPPDRPPLVTVSEHAGHVEVRVIDHGPGYRHRTGTGSSCRSSASATGTTPPVWASVWRFPVAWWRRWVARSSRRPRPVAALP